MTLREIGISISQLFGDIVQYWEQFTDRVSSKGITDWYLSDFFVLLFVFMILIPCVSHLIGYSIAALYSIAQRMKTLKLLLILDKRFGYHLSRFFVVVGTIVFVILIVLVAANINP